MAAAFMPVRSSGFRTPEWARIPILIQGRDQFYHLATLTCLHGSGLATTHNSKLTGSKLVVLKVQERAVDPTKRKFCVRKVIPGKKIE